ncbi:MAG: hypothetical protein H7039_10970 [Bryobacteraceae bacterium]|nr:hypothetical protein [Bryobacteraceae bacterium]
MIGDEQIQLSWDNLDRYRRNAWTDYNRAITQLSKMQKERKSAPVEELKKSEREERAEIRHREYLKRTVAPLVRWRNNPANADKLASFRQDETGAIVPIDLTPVTPDTQPIPVPEAA